jgi:outer membrane lipopolysaccharide assembly protein LptE/RlpB
MVKFSEMLPPEIQNRQLDIASKQAVRQLMREVLAALLRNKAQVLEQATSKNHPANKSAQPSDGAGVQSIDRVLRNQNSKIDRACCSLRLRSSPARGE